MEGALCCCCYHPFTLLGFIMHSIITLRLLVCRIPTIPLLKIYKMPREISLLAAGASYDYMALSAAFLVASKNVF